MKISVLLLTSLLIMLPAAAWGQSPTFVAAMKAVEAKDFPNAYGLMEKAIEADPENMRYASEYRMAMLTQAKSIDKRRAPEGKPADYDRELKFFEKLATSNPKSSNAFLQWGFAIVDQMPAAGAITKVQNARAAQTQFTKSLEVKPTWIAYYTRGNAGLFWPLVFEPMFHYVRDGVGDLEKAYEMQKAGPLKPFHLRVFVSLGDGYWKLSQMPKARAIWAEGLKAFPNNEALKQRVAAQDDQLDAIISPSLDPDKRVDTDLKELWSNP